MYELSRTARCEPGDRIKLMATGAEFDVVEVGYMEPFGLE